MPFLKINKGNNMANNESKKVALLYILHILEKYSDEEHPLTQEDIAKKLYKGWGIDLDRRAIRRNLDVLIEAGREIEEIPHKGVYLNERIFENSELRLLIDSVLFSKNISPKAAEDLVEKLKSLGSEHFGKTLKFVHNVRSISRVQSPEMFMNIDLLSDAITNESQVSFVYNEYRLDKSLRPVWRKACVVNPYQLISTNNSYYLVGNMEGYDNLRNFRLDKITNIKILRSVRKSIRETKEGRIDLASYIDEHPYMSQGAVTSVKIKIEKDKIDRIIASFGNNYRVDKEGARKAEVSFTANEEDIIQWSLLHCRYAEILAPAFLREKIRTIVDKVQAVYTPQDEGKEFALLLQNAERKRRLKLCNKNVKGKMDFSSLAKVRSVDIRNTDLDDVSFLKDYTELREVQLRINPISDLSCFAGGMFESLDLRGLPLKSIEFLKGSRIGELSLYGISVHDYSPLYQMEVLNELFIDDAIAQKIDLDALLEKYPNIEISVNSYLGYESFLPERELKTVNAFRYPLNLLVDIFGRHVGDEYLEEWYTEQEFEQMKAIFDELIKEKFTEQEQNILKRWYEDGESIIEIAEKEEISRMATLDQIRGLTCKCRHQSFSKKVQHFVKSLPNAEEKEWRI